MNLWQSDRETSCLHANLIVRDYLRHEWHQVPRHDRLRRGDFRVNSACLCICLMIFAIAILRILVSASCGVWRSILILSALVNRMTLLTTLLSLLKLPNFSVGRTWVLELSVWLLVSVVTSEGVNVLVLALEVSFNSRFSGNTDKDCTSSWGQ